MKYILGATVLLFSVITSASAADAHQTKDHYKEVYHKTPHGVEVCYDQRVDGDKTGDTLKGAIIGGIIGNNVGDIENGGALGAIVGGYIIAFSEVIITYAFKKVLVYLLPENLEPTGLVQLISTDYKFVVSYSILLLVLIFRPTGIFRGKSV